MLPPIIIQLSTYRLYPRPHRLVGCTVCRSWFVFFFCFPSRLLSSPFCPLSLLVVTQIRGHTAGSSPPLPTHYGSCLAFLSREDFSSFFPRRLASNCAYPRQALSAVDPFFSFFSFLVRVISWLIGSFYGLIGCQTLVYLVNGFGWHIRGQLPAVCFISVHVVRTAARKKKEQQ